MSSIDELLSTGLTQHKAGRLPEAEAAYRAILALQAEQYVSQAVRLANAPEDRAAFSRRILAGGDRLYRNENSVCELEDFFGRVAEALD